VHFIIENREWIFSGIGVFIISLIIAIICYLIKKNSGPPIIDPPPIIGPIEDPDYALKLEIARLMAKINALNIFAECPFVQVGSVYLDIILRPIVTTVLEKKEWDNLHPIRFDLGGSIVCVGRFLFLDHRQKSYLFSVKGGKGEPLSDVFDALMTKEKWPNNNLISSKPKSRPAVTVHLVQQDKSFSTMFTQNGSLIELGWPNIDEELSKLLINGGVLYIGGYYKTNLHNGFRENLEKYSDKSLVCIDHGSLATELISEQSINALREAFLTNAIDVYICTYSELIGYFEKSSKYSAYSLSGNTEKDLKFISKNVDLPIITYVRGSDIPGKIDAYAIVGKSVIPLEKKDCQIFKDSPVAPKNAFNATVLFSLIKGDRFQSIPQLVKNAGLEALKYCHKHRVRDVSQR
jgi:hypothetical protein